MAKKALTVITMAAISALVLSGSLGTFSSACTTTSSWEANATRALSGTAEIDFQLAGEIQMQELKNHLSIVGGTGKYKKARGQAALTRLDDQGAVQRVKLMILL